ncbi:hypothetical protein CHUAL_007116 [Chamberlinius hualienensis]
MKKFKLVSFLIFIFINVCLGQKNNDDEIQVEESPPVILCETSDGEPGFCTLLLSCPSLLANVDLVSNNLCNLNDNEDDGVCCSRSSQFHLCEDNCTDLIKPLNFTAAKASPPGPLSLLANSPLIDEKIIETSIDRAMEIIDELIRLENESLADADETNGNSEAEDLHDFINFAFPEAVEADKEGIIGLETSKQLADKVQSAILIDSQQRSDRPIRLPPGSGLNQSAGAIVQPSALSQSVSKLCVPEEIECPANKYRTISGKCNNEQNKDWGQSFTALSRMSFSARYKDGIDEPPVAKSGKPLPNCRKISTTVLKPSSKSHLHLNSLFPSFGQFVDHDLSHTPQHKSNGRFCCSANGRTAQQHCLPIEIPADDPFYKKFNVSCQTFTRSLTFNNSCKSDQREQINQLTSFLDASQIYGSLDRTSIALRSHKNGKLKTDQVNGEFPPHSNSSCVKPLNQELLCFHTGDIRVTEQPLLGTFHILFLREHNRIARRLAIYHQDWDDETIFQESRRIVIAIYQNIIYNEFLPILLGFHGIQRHDILLGNASYIDRYDPLINPSVINEFSAAAFRFGHSMVQEKIQLQYSDGRTEESWLVDAFGKPFNTSLFESFIRGALEQSSEEMDTHVITALTNHLFQDFGKFGLDLAAINCQRGRDHGLLSYAQIRNNHCFLDPVFSFKDLEKYMDHDVVESLSEVYEDVEDIDLWVGGIAERREPGAVVGPVFACIIGKQFQHLLHGDRFWFERGDTEFSFTEDQLKQIRKASLARLYCDHTDIKEIQPSVFFPSFNWNPKVSCEDSTRIPKVLLSGWKNDFSP